jgi:hypothetical protein
MLKLTLVIPDLFKPIQLRQVTPTQVPEVPALQQMLSLAQRSREPLATYINLLCRLFFIDLHGEESLPMGALCYLADFDTVEKGWYLRIDPVHLQIARDQLLLMDDYMLKVTSDEATQLVAELNQAYEEQGLVIHQGAPARWYLHLTEDPQLQTHGLPDVVGRNIQSYLMSGEARQRWHSFMNEVQMLLHASPVNATRVENGQPAINSVWLWGEGTLAQLRQIAHPPVRLQVYADDPLVKGLAKFSGAEVQPVPDNAAAWLEQADAAAEQLIVISQPATALRHGDTPRWLELITQLNESWAPALISALRERALTQLTIHDGNGRCFSLTPALMGRWWKRKRPLNQIINI